MFIQRLGTSLLRCTPNYAMEDFDSAFQRLMTNGNGFRDFAVLLYFETAALKDTRLLKFDSGLECKRHTLQAFFGFL